MVDISQLVVKKKIRIRVPVEQEISFTWYCNE